MQKYEWKSVYVHAKTPNIIKLLLITKSFRRTSKILFKSLYAYTLWPDLVWHVDLCLCFAVKTSFESLPKTLVLLLVCTFLLSHMLYLSKGTSCLRPAVSSCILTETPTRSWPLSELAPRTLEGQGCQLRENAMHHPHHPADGGHVVSGDGSSCLCHPGDSQGERGIWGTAQNQERLSDQ